jgi:hypothetical protein
LINVINNNPPILTSYFSYKKQFVKYVSRYITKPTRIQSRCKSNVIEKFGLMPPIGQNLTKEERTKVASWLFNNINVK